MARIMDYTPGITGSQGNFNGIKEAVYGTRVRPLLGNHSHGAQRTLTDKTAIQL